MSEIEKAELQIDDPDMWRTSWDHKQFRDRKQFLYGSAYGGLLIWKRRLKEIPDIEERRHRTLQHHKRPLQERWEALFKKLKAVGKCWGIAHDKYLRVKYGGLEFTDEGGIDRAPAVFTYSGSGVSHDWGFDEEEKILVLEPEELPPFMGDDSLSSELQELVKKRLDDTVKKMPRRDDLINEFFTLEARFRHVYKLITLCNAIMETWINNRYREKYSLRNLESYQLPKFATLTVNGRTYRYLYEKDAYNLEAGPEAEVFELTL